MRTKIGNDSNEDNTSDRIDFQDTSLSDYESLKADIQNAYEGNVTIDEAERLAAKFLGAQMEIASQLSKLDLDSRMKKNGLKATRARAYMELVSRSDKKPSEGYLDQHVNLDVSSQLAQKEYDQVDSEKESLELYLNIFKDAHIYFRGISKGRYE